MLVENIFEVYYFKKFVGQGEYQFFIFIGVELVVKLWQIIVLIGELGFGKLILLVIFVGFDDGSSGEVLMLGKLLYWMDEEVWVVLWVQYVGFVFQLFMLILMFNVLENVELLVLLCGVSDSQSWGDVCVLFEQLGFGRCLYYLLVQFFGGEQQWVVLVWVFNGCLVILFVDEFIGNFDCQIGDKIVDLLFLFNCEYGIILIFVIYDLLLVVCCDCCLCLVDGQLWEEV